MRYRLDASLQKSLLFGAIHLVIAVAVGYALTGSFVLAGAIALIEPACNTVAHYVFERWWSRRQGRTAGVSIGMPRALHAR